MHRSRTRWYAFVVAALASAAFAGDEAPKSEPLIDRVLDAYRAQDKEVLRALAARDEPDPWIVADVLCGRGEHDAAEAFARAAPRLEVEGLPAYVDAHRGRGPDADLRARLKRADRLRLQNKPQEVLKLLEDAGSEDGVPAATLHTLRGMAYHRLRRLKSAGVEYLAGAEIAQRMGWLTRAHFLLDKGALCHHYGGDRPLGLKTWKRALELARVMKNKARIAASLTNLGMAYGASGAYDRSLECYERALELDKELERPRGVAITLGNIGNLYSDLGEEEKALEYQAKSLELCEKLNDRVGVALAYGSMAGSYNALGEYDKALDCFERELAINRELMDPAGITAGLCGIGSVYRSLGQWGKALEFQERALEFSEKTGKTADRAVILSQIGAIHHRLGGLRTALGYYEQVLELNEKLGRAPGVAKTLGDIGLVYDGLGDDEKALRYHERALKLKRQFGNALDISTTLANLSALHGDRGEVEKALELRKQALALAKKAGARGHIANDLGCIGGFYADVGEDEKAIEHLRRALGIGRELGVSVDTWATPLGQLFLYRMSRPAEAIPYFEEAIASVEARRGAGEGLPEQTREAYQRKLASVGAYEGLADAQRRLGRVGEALASLEQGRARGVLDLLARSRLDPLAEAERRVRTRGDEETLAEIGAVRRELEAGEREIRRLTHARAKKRTLKTTTREELARLTKELREARGRRDVAVGRRARLVRDVLPVGAPASVASLQRALTEDERMLFYSVGSRRSLVFVVPPAGKEVSAFELSVRGDPLAKAVEAHLARIARKDGPARSFLESEEGKAPAAGLAGPDLLAALLPKAVREKLRGLRRVFVVPHGVLYRLPFETLELGDGKYWLDELPPVVYGHSGSVLLWCRARRAAQRAGKQRYAVVALGDPIFSRAKGTEVTPPEQGVLVIESAGELEAGDVIRTYDGRRIGDRRVLRSETRRVEDAIDRGEREPGAVRLGVWRAGVEHEVEVRPGRIEAQTAKEPPRAAWSRLRQQAGTARERGAGSERFGRLPPLPGTRREVTAIQDALGADRVAALLGERATKSRLFRLAPQGRFLHIATHGLADETGFRGYSRLALTLPRIATPGDDGFLSFFELFEDWRDRLSACELVVLSACESLKGEGPLQKDEGPYALPLGFLYAGAPAVVGSLWRVDDAATATLFADFYRRLAAGAPKLEAFTQARRALRKEDPAPYYWAPFVYIGDPD